MARRIAHARWTGELANGWGEVSAGGGRQPDPVPNDPPPAGRDGARDRRKRRAFEGEVISRIRARARHHSGPGELAKRRGG